MLACAAPTAFDVEAWAARWAASPAEAVASLYDDPDPMVQVDRVERIVMSHPELTEALCPALQRGPARARCEQYAKRPHLWVSTAPEPSAPVPQGALPALRCPEGRDQDACANQQALALAQKGRTEQAAELCRGISVATWRQECLFAAAETRVRGHDERAYADAVSLCEASGRFERSCLGHLSERMFPRVPSALASSRAWAPVLRAAHRVRAHWSRHDPEQASEMEARLWESILRHAVTNTPVLTGDLLETLPRTIHPHVRAMVALRLVELLDAPPASLSALHQMLDAALAARVPGLAGTPSKLSPRRALASYPDLWPEDADADSVAYLSDSRRAASQDAEVDHVLVLLEAVARVWPSSAARLLEEGRRHPSARVRQAASRLLDARN